MRDGPARKFGFLDDGHAESASRKQRRNRRARRPAAHDEDVEDHAALRRALKRWLNPLFGYAQMTHRL